MCAKSLHLNITYGNLINQSCVDMLTKKHEGYNHICVAYLNFNYCNLTIQLGVKLEFQKHDDASCTTKI